LKVLLIDVNCKNSSTGKIVYNLYSYLGQNGNEAAVCYGRGDLVEEKNIYKFGLDWETKLHALLTRITGYTGCFSVLSTKRLIAYIDSFKPDIVHIHELHAYFVNIKPLLEHLKAKQIKTVVTLHCEFAYTGKCGHSMDCTQWQTECRDCPNLREYVKTLWFDRTNHMFRQKKSGFDAIEELVVTAPSDWLASRAKLSFFKNRHILTVHNGVDTDVFCPCDANELRTQYDIKDGQKVILALAPNVLSHEKGGDCVLSLAEHPLCKDMLFILVGADKIPDSKPQNVIIEGRKSDPNLLAKYYSLADAFVICSTKENFPTTCLEAQCCGTPVYGFDTGGTLETSLVGKANFTKYGDIDSLAKLLSKCPAKCEETSGEIAGKASQKFGKTAMCEQYIAIYNILMWKE